MSDIINVKFLLLIVIIIFIFRHRKKLYTHQLSQVENYKNHSILDNNFMNFHKEIQPKKLYNYEVDKLYKSPRIFSNFRYSLEFKFGLEVSKKFNIKNQETSGLSENLKLLDGNTRDLFMCSETEYYQMLDDNPDFKKKYGYICGLYYQHFLFFISPNSKIENINDLKIYLNEDEFMMNDIEKDKNKIIKVGIPYKNTNSYLDALKLFNSIGIDINRKDYSNLKFIFDSEKNLISRLKPSALPDKKIDCLYLTTSEKHPYLQELLLVYNVNVVGTDLIKTNVIKSNYGGNHLFKNRISKNIFSKIVRQKNIYQIVPEYNFSTRLINNYTENLIIGDSYLDVHSTRIIIIASNLVNPNYVRGFLEHVYGNIDNLRNKLQEYLFYPNLKNYLPRCLEPYEISYVNQKYAYHPGAYDFFKDINFIGDSDTSIDNKYLKN